MLLPDWIHSKGNNGEYSVTFNYGGGNLIPNRYYWVMKYPYNVAVSWVMLHNATDDDSAISDSIRYLQGEGYSTDFIDGKESKFPNLTIVYLEADKDDPTQIGNIRPVLTSPANGLLERILRSKVTEVKLFNRHIDLTIGDYNYTIMPNGKRSDIRDKCYYALVVDNDMEKHLLIEYVSSDTPEVVGEMTTVLMYYLLRNTDFAADEPIVYKFILNAVGRFDMDTLYNSGVTCEHPTYPARRIKSMELLDKLVMS